MAMKHTSINCRVFLQDDFTPRLNTFSTIGDAINYLKNNITEPEQRNNNIYVEINRDLDKIILQRQDKNIMMQLFIPLNSRGNWYNLREKEPPGDSEYDLIDVEYQPDENLKQTHFRILGAEGTWASRELLVSKEYAIFGLSDVLEYVKSGNWDPRMQWITIDNL